ncbi:MAG: ABC transporter ATP-binding protein [Lachnospiraceae bacterium]|jgi:ABC-2 type transport system ATP-binding protein|nr:ABC transporter ATP-binding protein [Lachnospiraceae bacterium]
MGESVISLHGIQKSYGKHKVLRGVDLEIPKGDIFGLIGRNGAGKTTIFKTILGLSDYEEGSIDIAGFDKDPDKGRGRIGFFVGSDFFDYLSGRENLEYYRQLKGIKDRNEVSRVLKIVGLDTARGSFKNYSMGMKQRLGIANALMGSPEILILDEPTNGLDPQGIADMRHLFQDLKKQFGMTIIISSHILGELQNTADRFGIVNNGIIERVVTQEDLKKSDNCVRITVDDRERARKVLEEAGIKVLGEEQEARSLEDYYFNLLGGEQNA